MWSSPVRAPEQRGLGTFLSGAGAPPAQQGGLAITELHPPSPRATSWRAPTQRVGEWVSASRFTELSDLLIELVSEGLSLTDACREAEVPVDTVRGWLKRGRREESGPYARFAREIDEARAFEPPPGSLSEDELLEFVVRATKKGSVPAARLWWEILRAKERPPRADSLSAVDELAARRAQGKT